MAVDEPVRSGPSGADPIAPGSADNWAGRPVSTGESGVPGPPLVTALRRVASSSLAGALIGAVIVLTAGLLGWDNEGVGMAAIGAFGMPRIRRGYRLRAGLALTVTAAGCLVAGVLLVRGLPAPWDVFLPLAFALAVGSAAGTAAAYLPWRVADRG